MTFSNNWIALRHGPHSDRVVLFFLCPFHVSLLPRFPPFCTLLSKLYGSRYIFSSSAIVRRLVSVSIMREKCAKCSQLIANVQTQLASKYRTKVVHEKMLAFQHLFHLLSTNLKNSRVQPKVDVKNGQSMQVKGLLGYSSIQIIYFPKSLNNNLIASVRLTPEAFRVRVQGVGLMG